VRRPEYLFGDDEGAAQRLELLASVYRESTGAFLRKAAGDASFKLALDLGCGPGLTTHLLNDTLRCERVIGLDASADYVELARSSRVEGVAFLHHDITATPFPCDRANLIFARFLLTHLRDVAEVVAKWATQLEDGGLLLLEETEAIKTINPAFTRYLALVEAMLVSQANQLYAGRLIARLDSPGGLRCTFSELHRLAVANRDAARMFALNLDRFKHNDFVQANYSPSYMLELADDLRDIAASELPAREIEWAMRQAAWFKE